MLGGPGPDGTGGSDGGIFVNQLLKMEDGLTGADFGHRKLTRYLRSNRSIIF